MLKRAMRLAVRAYERLYYDLVLAPRGYGARVSKKVWDAAYQREQWGFFDTLSTLGHYMMITGYVHFLHGSQARVLEIGCGHGVLMELLHAFGFREYLGIDLSSEAIQRARALGVDDAHFEEADFESWEPPGQFDVVVFNESLYYARNPLETLRRHAELLSDGGHLIVSMHRSANHGLIWKSLAGEFEFLYSTRLENRDGQCWDVRVLRRRAD